MTDDERLAMNDEHKRVEADAAAEGRRFGNPARAARRAAQDETSDRWTPPVLRSVASKDEGVTELLDALDRHFGYLERSGTLRERRRARLRERVIDVVEQRVRQRLWTDAETNQWLDGQLSNLEMGATNPFDVADALLLRSRDILTRTSQ